MQKAVRKIKTSYVVEAPISAEDVLIAPSTEGFSIKGSLKSCESLKERDASVEKKDEKAQSDRQDEKDKDYRQDQLEESKEETMTIKIVAKKPSGISERSLKDMLRG